MKIKNKYIKKIITSGLIGSLLLGSVPFNSFANINNISTINTTSEIVDEISPQMLAVIASLATASGITITTNDDLYDLGRLFYDYIDINNDMTWDIIKTTFNSSVSVLNNGLVSTDSKFLDIVKGFFDDTFSGSNDVYFGEYIYPSYYTLSSTTWDSDFESNIFKISSKYLHIKTVSGSWLYVGVTPECNSISFEVVGNGKIKIHYMNAGEYLHSVTKTVYDTVSFDDVLFPYGGGYTWDNVDSKKENDNVSLPIPSNLSQLVGQTSEDFWNNTDNLINPCTQEIILPEVENPSINIGEPIKLQTETNCSIYNAEELVQKAEESKDVVDIENDRNEVNKLPEGDLKEELQNRLDNIVPNITLTSDSATANVDIYINSTSTLTMILDTNNITFEGFSGVEDTIKENALNVTVKSSLPYELNAYLVSEIQNADKSKTLDKSVLNIKANGTEDYKIFEDVGTTPIQLLDNQDAGEPNTHGIDFKLDSDVPYEDGNYKTVIKFEAKQK